jgi:hypothetical protein
VIKVRESVRDEDSRNGVIEEVEVMGEVRGN